MWRLSSLVFASVSLAATVVHAESTVRLEIGSEYDTNLHRLEVADDQSPDAGPLARFGVRFRGVTGKGRDRAVLSAYGGTKLFATGLGQSENALIVATRGAYAHRLPGRRLSLGVQGSYYDAIHYDAFDCGADCGQVAEGRFFSTAAGEGVVSVSGPGSHRLNAFAGYRRFEYKPDPLFDWNGDTYGVSYQAAIWRGEGDSSAAEELSSVDVVAGYRVSRRNYRGSAFADVCGEDEEPSFDCFVPTSFSRVDFHHAASIEAAYTGERLYSARYEMQVNDSNSVGQSLLRQRFELEMTTELVSNIFVTATAAVQLNIFLDSLLLARDVDTQTIVSIDDENRNSLSLHLSRGVGAGWTVEGRYSIFTNEFATQQLTFRRQTGYLGLVYDYD